MRKTKIIPIGDLIAIERLIEDKKIETILPNQKSIGKVINIGSGILKNDKKYTFNIKNGDFVMFETHRGYTEKINGKKIVFLSLNNVLAKIDNNIKKDEMKINIKNSNNSFLI